ncbi:unnamed protein product [Lupinus luteus]|uniref:Uncharacterized protein n=1 Tax=Lupinus luteus TaxID=3873 RepID=A0AAV1XQ75_LUPLU
MGVSQKNDYIKEDIKSCVHDENLMEENLSTMKDVIRLIIKEEEEKRANEYGSRKSMHELVNLDTLDGSFPIFS